MDPITALILAGAAYFAWKRGLFSGGPLGPPSSPNPQSAPPWSWPGMSPPSSPPPSPYGSGDGGDFASGGASYTPASMPFSAPSPAPFGPPQVVPSPAWGQGTQSGSPLFNFPGAQGGPGQPQGQAPSTQAPVNIPSVASVPHGPVTTPTVQTPTGFGITSYKPIAIPAAQGGGTFMLPVHRMSEGFQVQVGPAQGAGQGAGQGGGALKSPFGTSASALSTGPTAAQTAAAASVAKQLGVKPGDVLDFSE